LYRSIYNIETAQVIRNVVRSGNMYNDKIDVELKQFQTLPSQFRV